MMCAILYLILWAMQRQVSKTKSVPTQKLTVEWKKIYIIEGEYIHKGQGRGVLDVQTNQPLPLQITTSVSRCVPG